jgi:hypothetical protein
VWPKRTGEPGTGKDEDEWGRELVNREPGTGKGEVKMNGAENW